MGDKQADELEMGVAQGHGVSGAERDQTQVCSLDVTPGMRELRDVKTGDSQAGGTFGFRTLGHRDSTQVMSHMTGQ